MWTNILTEGVFVTRLSRNVGILGWMNCVPFCALYYKQNFVVDRAGVENEG